MVQHYFASKEQMLLFALNWVGEEFAARITAKIGALTEPRDPYEIVWIVLSKRLPLQPRSRVHVQVLIAWLAHGSANPDLAQRLRQEMKDRGVPKSDLKQAPPKSEL